MEEISGRRLTRTWEAPGFIRGIFANVDHKQIGLRYIATAFVFMAEAGTAGLVLRTQLAIPDNTFVSPDHYNQVFTLHGTVMIFLFATPLLIGGLGNYLVPLMIGSRDMAFPRLNALSYWIYLFAGMFIYCQLLHREGPQRRLVRLRSPHERRVLARPEPRLLGARHRLPGYFHDGERDQFHRHDLQAARPGHEHRADAAVRLGHARDVVCDHLRAAAADARRGAARARPPVRHALLRPGRRRQRPAVAAPVLGVRPSRGLHHVPARSRHRFHHHPDVCAHPDRGLHPARPLVRLHRLHQLRRLGPPHVFRRTAAISLAFLRRGGHGRSPSPAASRYSPGSRRSGRATSSGARRSCSSSASSSRSCSAASRASWFPLCRSTGRSPTASSSSPIFTTCWSAA